MERTESMAVRELRVEKIVIERDGRPVMEIGSDEDGGRIVVYSSGGVPLVWIAVDGDCGWIAVCSRKGVKAVEVSVDNDGNGYILLYDEQEEPQIGLGVTREGDWNVLLSEEAAKKLEDFMS
jgi:hypothetical protein